MIETLTELREMATKNIAWLDGLSDDVIAVLGAFLVLTDPEPLEPSHCPPDWVRDDVFQRVTSPDGGACFDYHGGQRYLTVCEATRGQLNFELMKENRDGK